jgi:GNAT superfamily N-acetyltransferase
MITYPGRASGIPLSRVVPREFGVCRRALVPIGGESFLLTGGLLFVVREAKWGDLARLAQLHKLSGEDLGKLDPRLAPEPGDAERFKGALRAIMEGRGTVAMVAEDERGRVVGCVIGTVAKNSPFAVQRYGYLSCLYAGPGWRESGMGDSMVIAACDWFKREGLSVVHADVSVRDRKSQRFWRARGFDHYLDHLRLERPMDLETPDVAGVMVREAESEDREAVIRLWKEMMDFHAPIDGRLRLGSGWRNEVARATRHWLRDRDTRLLVADSAGGVIGFVLGGVVDVVYGLKLSTHGHIAHLCVAGDWRRRGVGRLLCSSLRTWFLDRGMLSVHAYVSHFSPVSQGFWRALGFEEYVQRLWCDLA